MPISRKRGYRSIDELIERGLITPEQSKAYAAMVKEGVSYRDLMIGELGKVIGELYVREEEAQHKILHDLTLNLTHLSVPEVLLLEDNIGLEPWHGERYSELKAKAKFEQEAGEPWHKSLLDRFRPDRRIRAWFRSQPSYKNLTREILRLAYGM